MKSKEFDYWLSKVKPDNKIFVDLNLAIAKQVRHYLNTRNKSQKALAAVLEISESEISKWLSGLHNLTLEDIARMQDVLGEEIIMTDQMAKEKYGKPSGIDLDKFKFVEWVGERMCKDSWFKYDPKNRKWYVHMRGHITTEELYSNFKTIKTNDHGNSLHND